MNISVRQAATVAAALLVTPLLTTVGPAQALDGGPEGVGPRDPGSRDFPSFYKDTVGTALQMCDDGSGTCLGATDAALAPPEGENFYWMATGTLSDGAGIDISVEFALEAAWLDGQRQVFDRLRVRGHVDQAGTYTLTHPYGTATVLADDPAEQRNVNFTEDIGCEPAPGAPCDFRAAVTSPDAHITDWLVSTTRPAGYLGDAATERPATVGIGGPAASMSITGPSGTASTSSFAVMGKLANPNAMAVPRTFDFGNVRRARTRRVRIVNTGTQAQTLQRIALTGAATFRRVQRAKSCATGDSLAVGQACTVALRYRPSGRRASAATLRITTPARVHRVRVRAKTSAVFSARDRMRFRARRAGTVGHKRRIVITNTGALPLRVRRVFVAGRNRGSFDLRSGAPRVCRAGARVPVGGTCGVYVRFEPRGFGTKTARIVVRTNAVNPRGTIRLSGRAR